MAGFAFTRAQVRLEYLSYILLERFSNNTRKVYLSGLDYSASKEDGPVSKKIVTSQGGTAVEKNTHIGFSRSMCLRGLVGGGG